MLRVPNLSCNLLSVSKLVFGSFYQFTFNSFGCILRDRHSGKMIDNVKESVRLFYLDSNLSKQIQQPQSSSLLSLFDAILLLHFHLGHPSFVYLKHLFPALFENKDFDSLQCEICQLAKHKRSVFLALNYMPSKPFSVIHSDMWGPSKVKKISHELVGSSFSLMI